MSRPKGVASLVLVVLCAVALAACGSSNSSSSSSSGGSSGASSSAAATSSSAGTSSGTGTTASGGSGGATQAKQLVSQEEQPPPFKGPTSKVNLAKAKGKTVYYVSLTEEIPALHEWGVVLGQQLQAAGVHIQKCDAKGSPDGITTCLTQALAAKPAMIVAQALDTKFIASYISRAKAQGIKFVTAQTGTPGIPTVSGDDAEVTFDYPQVGRILADWFVADSGCTKGGAQIITSTSSRQPSAAEVAGIQGEVKKLCPSLSMPSVQNVLIPDWPTKLSTTTRSLLTASPNLDYLLPLYDGMTIYMVPAINGILAAKSRVKVASFNATPVVIQNELVKQSPLAADVGGPNQWYGVALADQVLRVLAGQPPVANENVPLRLFTRDNVSSIDPTKDESTWYGSANPICEYHKLWGLPCT
ncbi:MAG: substrate-binding domain-containing protein [Solirubrobacteraceae bacterium]